MQFKKRYLALILLGVIGWFGYQTFVPHQRVLAQEVFYSSPDLELMLILRHDNYPLHYVGNAYTVACKSKTTADMPAYDSYKVPAGWNTVPGFLGSASGDDTDQVMADLLTKAKATYIVAEGLLLVPDGTNLWVSADSCYGFTNWSLQKSLPTDTLIKNLPAYDQCEEGRRRDIESGIVRSDNNCQYFNFFAEGEPVYKDIKVDEQGTISFTVSALALGGQELMVASIDKGKTWKTTSYGIQRLQVSQLETDNRFLIEVTPTHPTEVTALEILTAKGRYLLFYDMGEEGDKIIGDGIFTVKLPNWMDEEELDSSVLRIQYSNKMSIERPLDDFLE